MYETSTMFKIKIIVELLKILDTNLISDFEGEQYFRYNKFVLRQYVSWGYNYNTIDIFKK